MSTDATRLDLKTLSWGRLVAEASVKTCEAYASTLSTWLERGDMDEVTRASWLSVLPVLDLQIVSDPEQHAPFRPFDRYSELGRGAMVPLVDALPAINDAELRARIIDVAWQKRACSHDVAAQGVSAYIQAADALFDRLSWIAPYERLKRALDLGTSLGRNSAARAEAIADIERTIERVGVADERYFVERLMRLLLAIKAGDPARMAPLAGEIAAAARLDYQVNGVGNGLQGSRERDYMEVQLAWLRRAGEDAAARRVSIDIAEAFVRHAEGIVNARWPMHFAVAAKFVQDAITQLRKVGGQHERVTALRFRMEELQRSAAQEMPAVGLELDEAALDNARAHVAGKPLEVALLSLAFGVNPDAIEELERHVQESAQVQRFRTYVPASYVGPRGATQASHAGLEANDAEDADEAFAIEVMRHASERQQFKAAMFVAPALQQVMADHNLETAFFLALAWRSEFVPDGRKRSFGLGLAAGARSDFDVAAALLFPQFEHAMRELFHKNAVVTTTLPSSGIQNELDLNGLLAHEAMPRLFGPRLTYDLRVLLTEKVGSNLRNDLAHGVIDDRGKAAAKVYFWWICLRFAFDPFVEARQAPAPSGNGQPT